MERVRSAFSSVNVQVPPILLSKPVLFISIGLVFVMTFIAFIMSCIQTRDIHSEGICKIDNSCDELRRPLGLSCDDGGSPYCSWPSSNSGFRITLFLILMGILSLGGYAIYREHRNFVKIFVLAGSFCCLVAFIMMCADSNSIRISTNFCEDLELKKASCSYGRFIWIAVLDAFIFLLSGFLTFLMYHVMKDSEFGYDGVRPT